MEVPDYMQPIMYEGIQAENMASMRRSLWATVLGLVPYLDGEKWCVLLGDNIQVGICGYGDTPEAAMWDFDRAMREKVVTP